MSNLAYVHSTVPAERRQRARRTVDSASTLRVHADGAVDVIVSDLSENGCAIMIPYALDIGGVISIALVGFGTFEAVVVRKNGNMLGCAFVEPIDPEIVDNAFTAATPVLRGTVAPPTAANRISTEPHVEKWSIGHRAMFWTGSIVASWAAVFALGSTIS